MYAGLWLFLNTQLPGNDAANYLMTSVDIFHSFKDHGFWHGIGSAYFHRGWRPIFFPLFAVPFLLIFQGNLYFSYTAVAMLCMIASVIYIYLFFRLQLERFSAVIATSLVALLPFLQAQALMFYAEAALFPCVIGCLYHLIKSDYLRNRKHACGFMILLALAFAIRPVEAVTHFIFVFILFFFLGYYRSHFSIRQIISVLAISLTMLFGMFLLAVLPYIHFVPVHNIDDGGVLDKKMAKMIHSGLIGVGISALLIWVILVLSRAKKIGYYVLSSIEKHSHKTLLVPVFFIALMLVFIWFLPAGFETFQWVYRTSLGDVASSTGSLTGSHFSWDVLQIYIRAEGILPVIGIILIAVIAFFSLSHLQKRSLALSHPFIFLLLLAPFPIWEAFYTVQIVTRKLSIAIPAMLMAFLLLALSRGRGWFFRIVSIAFLTCMLFGLNIFSIFIAPSQKTNSLIKNTVGYFVPEPVKLRPNPHHIVIDFLTTQAARYHLTSIAMELNPGTPDARHPLEAEPVDPFLISTMAVASKQPYSVSYPYFSVYSPNNIRDMASKYDAVFLFGLANEMVISKTAAQAYFKQYIAEKNPSLKTLYEFLTYYSKNKLIAKKWIVGPCINIKTEKYEDYRGCLLLRRT
jgi:hypothetical protein